MDEQGGTWPVLIGESFAAVWVNPAARNAGLVYRSNRAATRQALENGVAGTPKVADMLAARHGPANPFFTLE
jgi:5,6,7,8-tetrahydromethanopterin hydro-lyase